MKHLERLKKVVKWAAKNRWIVNNPFQYFSLKQDPTTIEFLSKDQLDNLERFLFHSPKMQLVRDLFVFSCYTGMAPADMQRLQSHQIYKGIDDLTWLTYSRTKSNRPANVPLLQPAIEIINKYKINKGDVLRDTVFPFVTNKDLNMNLKIISEICELGLSLNFYMARQLLPQL